MRAQGKLRQVPSSGREGKWEGGDGGGDGQVAVDGIDFCLEK